MTVTSIINQILIIEYDPSYAAVRKTVEAGWPTGVWF
ncbi:hypothetical protein PAXY110619_29955 [Paenibacillus xylanexedens]|uniref:Uncharacterized protein n=1 Tax=Paenibacillus xylanexedens TaxID=528191 RepID=A0ABS4RSJ6_PAEXY|nr:hypothetical protein [Paenibacillus xylanexedens]